MKIQFSDNLEYQKEAIDSIVNVFEGQELAQDNFTVTVHVESVVLLTKVHKKKCKKGLK